MTVRFVRQNYNLILTVACLLLVAGHAIAQITPWALGLEVGSSGFACLMNIVGPPTTICLLVVYILIFSKRLRDEYVDKLWGKAARSFAILLLSLPWIWLLVWNTKALVAPNVFWLPKDPNALILPTWGENPKSAAALQMGGVQFVLASLFTFGPIVFTMLYKWHAWRDRA